MYFNIKEISLFVKSLSVKITIINLDLRIVLKWPFKPRAKFYLRLNSLYDEVFIFALWQFKVYLGWDWRYVWQPTVNKWCSVQTWRNWKTRVGKWSIITQFKILLFSCMLWLQNEIAFVREDTHKKVIFLVVEPLRSWYHPLPP